MDDNRIWEFERDLWVGGPEVYRKQVSDHCLMGLPEQPFVFDGEAAIAAVIDTPRWDEIVFSETRVTRPQEGLIVIAYRAAATRKGAAYHAVCTSTLHRRGHEDWVVIQHQQTPFGVEIADPNITA